MNNTVLLAFLLLSAVLSLCINSVASLLSTNRLPHCYRISHSHSHSHSYSHSHSHSKTKGIVTRESKLHFSINKEASYQYEFDEKLEAGIVLQGTEVKSCRKGQVQLSDGLAQIINGELWLLNVHIAEHSRCGPYDQHKPKRVRKLLVHRREILKLEQRMIQNNYEIIPIRMYFSQKNFVKVELGVGKKKSVGDKRDDISRRDGDRQIQRAMKGRGYD